VTYIIALPCVDLLDKSCIEECPVDCIYEGERMLYIHPDECVDCGACEAACPVEAIYCEDDLPEKWQAYAGENARFFAEPLPGRGEPARFTRRLRQARRRGCRHAVRCRASSAAVTPPARVLSDWPAAGSVTSQTSRVWLVSLRATLDPPDGGTAGQRQGRLPRLARPRLMNRNGI
jgi:NAD-dependent dihydropyrimidine dehydrogenase PreA subunit